MKIYKVTRLPVDIPDKYFGNLMQAISKKQILNKLQIDGDLYHIYVMPQNNYKWYKLE